MCTLTPTCVVWPLLFKLLPASLISIYLIHLHHVSAAVVAVVMTTGGSGCVTDPHQACRKWWTAVWKMQERMRRARGPKDVDITYMVIMHKQNHAHARTHTHTHNNKDALHILAKKLFLFIYRNKHKTNYREKCGNRLRQRESRPVGRLRAGQQ